MVFPLTQCLQDTRRVSFTVSTNPRVQTAEVVGSQLGFTAYFPTVIFYDKEQICFTMTM